MKYPSKHNLHLGLSISLSFPSVSGKCFQTSDFVFGLSTSGHDEVSLAIFFLDSNRFTIQYYTDNLITEY